MCCLCPSKNASPGTEWGGTACAAAVPASHLPSAEQVVELIHKCVTWLIV